MVAMEGRDRRLVAFRSRLGDEFPERTLRLALLGRPEQSVVPANDAAECLRIFQDAVAITVVRIVLALRIDDREACLDGREFVAPDASVEDFVHSGRSIKRPDRKSTRLNSSHTV